MSRVIKGVDESRKEVNPRRQEALLPSWDAKLSVGAMTEGQCERRVWGTETSALHGCPGLIAL